MGKRDYYIRTYRKEIGEDGVGIQIVDIGSEAQALDWEPNEMLGAVGVTVGKITVELFDGHNIKQENLEKLVGLFYLNLSSSFEKIE